MDVPGGYITWSGVASCGVSVILYLLSGRESVRLQHLTNTLTLPTLGDVEEINTDSLPMIVAIRGRAATNEPITSELTSTPAVIAEILEELSSKSQNERGEWSSESRVVNQQRWEAAWYLTDESAMRVDVTGTLHANLLNETYQIAKEFRAGQRSVYNKIIDKLTGYEPLGVRKTERILAVNTPLTIIGELDCTETESGESRFVIGRPSSGLPFYITDKSMEDLKDSFEKVVRSHRWLAFGFGAIGFALLGTKTFNHIKSVLRYRQIRRQLENQLQVQSQEGEDSDTKSSTARLDGVRKINQCIVCWDCQADAAFIPCGHNCVCRRCGMELKRCPICRKHGIVYKIFPV
eukprot:g183.t1